MFLGLLFATFINIIMDILGYFLVVNSFLSNYAPVNVSDPTVQNYIWTFFLKFIVLSTLAWIMYRVMTMLDTPKKRILFIFFILIVFTHRKNIYNLKNQVEQKIKL